MSIIIKADLAASMVMGDVVVCIVIAFLAWELDGVDGWVRLKPVFEEWSQKFEGAPMFAVRCVNVVESGTR